MRNLHRLSDPIGGPILIDYPATEATATEQLTDEPGDNDDIDRRLIDPTFAWVDGDIGYPPTRGHSGYADDPAYPASIAILRTLREARPDPAVAPQRTPPDDMQRTPTDAEP